MTYADLRTLFHKLTKTNTTSVQSAELNAYFQPAEDDVVALINNADSRWQFDDSNYTDLPIATTSLVSGQKDYSLATSHLSIDRVELLPSGASTWELLTPIDQHDIRDTALTAHLPTSGQPLEYDKVGGTVFLYPTPNYSQAASLKIHFTRGALHFDFTTSTFTDASGSTSSSPGFNSLFHELIALKAARKYAVAKTLANRNDILLDIDRLEQRLTNFYGMRSRDERPRLIAKRDSNK